MGAACGEGLGQISIYLTSNMILQNNLRNMNGSDTALPVLLGCNCRLCREKAAKLAIVRPAGNGVADFARFFCNTVMLYKIGVYVYFDGVMGDIDIWP